jgi:hypothetical protein
MEQREQDRLKIEQTLQDYFHGMHHGRADLILKCFHEDGVSRGYMNDTGQREDMTAQEFADFVEREPTPSENGEKFDMTVRSIELAGKVAMVEVRDFYMGMDYTDYLLLVNEDDRWTIFSKLWHAE